VIRICGRHVVGEIENREGLCARLCIYTSSDSEVLLVFTM
jgi:hypothetical protein